MGKIVCVLGTNGENCMCSRNKWGFLESSIIVAPASVIKIDLNQLCRSLRLVAFGRCVQYLMYVFLVFPVHVASKIHSSLTK